MLMMRAGLACVLASTLTAASDPELFYAMPWSHGTLGFLTKIKVRLVRTKPYIRLMYEPTSTPEELTERMAELAALPKDQSPDFLEATLYDAKRAGRNRVICRIPPEAAPSVAAPSQAAPLRAPIG